LHSEKPRRIDDCQLPIAEIVNVVNLQVEGQRHSIESSAFKD